MRWKWFVVLFALVGMSGCGRPEPNDPQADLAAATEIRGRLVSSGGEAGGGAVASAATGTGWATLKGTFRLANGAAIPARKPLTVNKDVGACAPAGRQVLSEALLIDSATRGIANVVVFARKVSREHEAVSSPPESALFDQKECIFLSHVLPIRLGQTLKILNSDPVGHNTNIDAKRGSSFNQTVPDGGEITFKPDAEESAPVSVTCSIHPWMQAYILPRKNGYFAVTKPDGSFEIANLPDGEEIEFQVWHESGTGPGGALAGVEVAGVKWNAKGRFKLKLTENETKSLEVTVPAGSLN